MELMKELTGAFPRCRLGFSPKPYTPNPNPCGLLVLGFIFGFSVRVLRRTLVRAGNVRVRGLLMGFGSLSVLFGYFQERKGV